MTPNLEYCPIALSVHKTDMQLEMGKMEKETKDLTASLSRIQEKWEGKISKFQVLEKKIGELEQGRQDMVKMMEAKGKADTNTHLDLKVAKQKIQDEHSRERREADVEIDNQAADAHRKGRQGKTGVYSKGNIIGDGNDLAEQGSHRQVTGRKSRH